MLAKVLSSAVLGVDAYLVAVEVDIALGLPTFNTVGLPDVAVKESRDRVKAAIKNSGFEFPAKRITVNLAPVDIKKERACGPQKNSSDLLMLCQAPPSEGQKAKPHRDFQSVLGSAGFLAHQRVQRRLACSVGDRPTGRTVRTPVT